MATLDRNGAIIYEVIAKKETRLSDLEFHKSPLVYEVVTRERRVCK